MKTDELQNQDDLDDYKPAQKRGRKNKAEASKVSKASNVTRRRQQPDSSEEYLLPNDIPQTTSTELIMTEGFENELTKVLITVPYSILQGQKLQGVVQTHVQKVGVIFSIEKQLDNVTVFAKLPNNGKKMQVQDQQKIPEPTEVNDKQKIQESSYSVKEEYVCVVNFWGKYVYLSGYDTQNKGIKKIRKQLSTIEYGQIAKFKVKEPNSDLFIYLNLRLEQYLSYDYNGLINQGNTCYMNSYLQTLYHIPAFRNLVYQAEIQDENKFPATLQELFFNLGTSQKAVSPEALVKSFGWGRRQASIQQDAQEFSCLFFEALQRKLNNSAPKMGYRNRTIEGLFKGSLSHYIRCTNVGTVIDYTDFRNENFEEFNDLQLSIAPTLTESLDLYTTEVHLEGDNAYYTEQYGKQQAYKGVKLGYLPPVLMIQLKRFEYNFVENKNVKILSSLEYEDELDFSRWSTSPEKNIYQLYAVLVHQGARAQSGHYYNYVKVADDWYKFNDEVVQKVDKQKAFNYNFGGFHESLDFDTKQMKVNKKFIDSKITAYMLVYVKKALKQQLFEDQGRLPEWIQKKNINKLQMEEDKISKKNFFHNVAFIDWQQNLEWKICSDTGFLNEYILESAKRVIQTIPKEANLAQWLLQEKIIEHKKLAVEQKKKKSKKCKSDSLQNEQPKQPGIYVFYCTDRQLLTGFIHKGNHKMIDLLKVSSDPVIFKAPFQARKDEYLGVIKRYKVDKKDGVISTSFFYETCLPIRKQISYVELLNQLTDRFVKVFPASSQNSSESPDKFIRYNFYIDDLKHGAVSIQAFTGPVPLQSPKFNQLLVCVVEEISFEMSLQEQMLHSFPKYYQIKKNIVELTAVQEKAAPVLVKRDVNGNETLSGLRKIIFDNMPLEKQEQYGSPENIVLKARLKKGGKTYTQVSEPDFKTTKQITRIDERIEFTFSVLTVESRLSQFMIQIHYRNRNKQISEPIDLVVEKSETSQALVRTIKSHSKILQMLQVDGFTKEQAEMILLAKHRHIINDIVTDEGKVIGKGQFETVIKKQKNAIVIVEGRTVLEMEVQSNLQINEQQFQPIVNILLHHVTSNGQNIGIPLHFKVDRRMQLTQLRTKILDLIKDQTLFWENKFYVFDQTKTKIFLYGKDTKKVIELTDLESLEGKKKLKVQEKTNNNQTKRKKSKQINNSSRKQSNIEQINEAPLDTVLQISKQEQPHVNGDAIDVDKQTMKPIQKHEVIDISDEGIEKEQKIDESEQERQPNGIQDPEITHITGPQTVYGVFPKPKVLKIQVLHGYLTKPNVPLKFYLED